MAKRLSDEQVAFFAREGYLSPLPCLGASEIATALASLETFEKTVGYSANEIYFKGHLAFPWSWRLARHPAILDVVEDLLGPNLMVFASKFWVKSGSDGAFVSWHQDSAYFGLEPNNLATVWVALTNSDRSNGCVRVMPRSHTGPAYSHIEKADDEQNMLARGQRIEGLDDAQAVDLELRAGEFSIHHVRTVHGSLANDSGAPRIGIGLFYIPTSVQSTIGRRTADLVRGEDAYGHWDADPAPSVDGDPAILAHAMRAHSGYVDPAVAQEADEKR